MKINDIKINSYGKLLNKKIKLSDNINIIYGKNESGKSTFLNFLISILYGISKNKNGKDLSDFEKFTPWNGMDFSGRINYELDNLETYEVFRDFTKKNPKIFNSQMEDVSKNYTIDKTKGIQFFLDQTKMDLSLFLSSLIVTQEDVKLGKNEQNTLIQKITNLVGTGEDNVSYQKAIDILSKRQLNEIGSQSSRQKPINLLAKKIDELQSEKFSLKQVSNIQNNIDKDAYIIQSEISNLEHQIDLLKELKLIFEKRYIDEERLKLQQNIIDSNSLKQNEINSKIKLLNTNKTNISNMQTELLNKKVSTIKSLNIRFAIISLLLIILNILQFIFINNLIATILGISILFIYILVSRLVTKKKKTSFKDNETNISKSLESLSIELTSLTNELNNIQSNTADTHNEIDRLNYSITTYFYAESNNLKNLYKNKISNNILDKLLNIHSLDSLTYEITNITEEINSQKLRLHKLSLDKENINNKNREISTVEEELNNCIVQKQNLEDLNLSIEYAKLYLRNAYEKMKNTISPKFTKSLSDISSSITNSKYSNIQFTEDSGLIAELENGNYEPISKLSVGTIDQLYLSFRLSMAKDIVTENMPIILDEAFAYYDTERLSNVLKYINTNFNDHQIIILTCTNREKNILNDLNIPYNHIEI